MKMAAPQPAHINMLHTHNQLNQHGCDAKTSYTTTTQQPKNQPKPKNSPKHKPKVVL